MQLSAGMDIPDPWVREQTGIPQPTPGEAIFRVRQSSNEPAMPDRETLPEKQEKTEQTALSARLTTLQTDTVTVPDKKTATAVLSAEDIAAARLLGKTEAEFLKMKEEMQ